MYNASIVRVSLSLSVFLLAATGLAQNKVTEDNYASYFKQLMQKNAYLYYEATSAYDKPQFLGRISNSKYDKDSLADTYGNYGSTTNSTSIWNKYGSYGGTYGSKTPWSQYGRTRIEIRYNVGKTVYIAGVLSANKYIGEYSVPIVDPKFLAYWLDRPKDIP